MDIEKVRDYALSLPHVTERCPYGPDTLAFEIGGKQFCLLALDGEGDFYNLKVDPDYSIELQEHYTSISPGYHMNKKHWISVQFRGDVPDSLQLSLIEHAYYQTAKGLTKKLRQELGLNASNPEL